MAQTKGEGAGVGDFATGSLIEKHNVKLIKVDVGADLRSEDDATREAVERALQFIQPLAFFAVDDNSGVIHCVVDGSNFDASASVFLMCLSRSSITLANCDLTTA